MDKIFGKMDKCLRNSKTKLLPYFWKTKQISKVHSNFFHELLSKELKQNLEKKFA